MSRHVRGVAAATKSKSRAACSRSASSASPLIQALSGLAFASAPGAAASTSARERNRAAVLRSAATTARVR